MLVSQQRWSSGDSSSSGGSRQANVAQIKGRREKERERERERVREREREKLINSTGPFMERY